MRLEEHGGTLGEVRRKGGVIRLINHTYILFDGLARNTGQYFTGCGRIFPSPVGARKNASNE